MQIRSVGSVLDANRGIGPGFDVLRVLLAVGVLYSHCFGIADGSHGLLLMKPDAAAMIDHPAATHLATSPIWSALRQLRLMLVLGNESTHFTDVLVPMFFALSGFLVTGSAFRTKAVGTFLAFRVFRIVPALFVEVSLSAFILGPALTSVPLREYFSDPKFVDYFGNIIGRVRFQLPGLFLSNPLPDIVNGNLRTLPAEFYCYLIIAALILSGALFHRLLFTIAFATITVAVIIFGGVMGFEESALSNLTVVYYFFCGAFFYHWRDKIPLNPLLLLVSCAALYFHYLKPSSVFFFPILLTYVTVYLGASKLPTLEFLRRGDYSYGIYLYGFPITQALVLIVAKLQGHGFLLFLATTPIVLGFAMLSWRLIEKPTLDLKKFVLRSSVAKVA